MSDYFDRVERQLVERVERGRARSPRRSIVPGYLAMAAAVIVVIVVAGAFLLARGSGAPTEPPAAHGSVSVVLSASPARPSVPALDRAVRILRARLHAVFPDVEVTRAGEQIVVDVRNAPAGARSEILVLTAPGRLALYDWEGDVLAPDGKTVASQLRAGNPTALKISQGDAATAPGEPGAGGLSLHKALLLIPKATKGGRFALVQATDPDPRHPTPPGAPNARFYVLRGPPGMSGAALTNPHVRAAPGTGSPDVAFDFTARGRRAFQALTATEARRGSLVSGLGQTLNQHFAVALDNQLITVPFIDFKQYPDGINGDRGADIAGNLTTRSARDLAILLRFGPLPADFRAAG
jgi:SecD/SecF fusion protein